MSTHPPARTARELRGTAPTGAGQRVALAADPLHVEAITRSHERCGALGVSPIRAPDHASLIRADLAVARERNRRLSVHSAPVMEMLLEQILATQSMVVLTDVQGTVLHSVGPDDFLVRASKVALAPGANWSEQNKGTNAIGTSLVTEAPTLVHAGEHFMHANQFLTCSAAPVYDPRGHMVGVLDVSGDQHSFNPHTMGLVSMSARMIQNHWLVEDAQQALRLHFHARAEYLGTLMECIVVAGPDGRLLGANRAALDQLGLSGAGLRMNTLTDVFGVRLGALVDHFSGSMAPPLPLRLADGRQVFGRARFSGPSWQARGAPRRAETGTADDREAGDDAAPATPSRTAAEPLPSLRQLQTGDAQMDAVIERVRRVIDRDIAILIQGETGTGKELLARALHQATRRAAGPFVAVHCASIPEDQIEAELFGHADGGFAAARRPGTIGKLMQAQGGTLFLDEIGDMPLALQARLLRVLQEREAPPPGGGQPVPIDVTVISATQRPLRDRLADHRFREDLYYRLNGLVVTLPPLRERTDLMALVDRLLGRECRGRIPSLDDELLRLMQGYAWPGNVRQLATVLRTAAAMAGDAATIVCEHLSEDFLLDARRAVGDAASAPASHAPGPAASVTATPPLPPVGPPATAPTDVALLPPGRTLHQLEIDAARRALEEAGGNISVAARRLGVSRNTIYRKLFWPPGAGR